MTDQREENTSEVADESAEHKSGIRRRTLLKAGWTLPLVTMIPLPQEAAHAQSGDHTDGGTHADSHGDHND